MNAPNEMPLEISCRGVKDKLDTGEPFLLLDCREADEYVVAHIEGARLIAMSELANRLDELVLYRDQEVVVHCHHGGRSERVANWLRGQGYSKARTMVGGIDRWAAEIDRSVARY
jgi:rhodanese-related sulfurtransferase